MKDTSGRLRIRRMHLFRQMIMHQTNTGNIAFHAGRLPSQAPSLQSKEARGIQPAAIWPRYPVAM